MNMYEWSETILLFVVLLVMVKPFGTFMARVYQGERTLLSPILLPCENLLYRVCGVNREEEMEWQRYAVAMLLFNLVCGVTLFTILLLQGVFPLNPQKFPAFSWHLALNTA
ncbi:MAG TPA: potassium-transporting ATPase subunit KdpA, partial [Geobacteraceae bacterium]